MDENTSTTLSKATAREAVGSLLAALGTPDSLKHRAQKRIRFWWALKQVMASKPTPKVLQELSKNYVAPPAKVKQKPSAPTPKATMPQAKAKARAAGKAKPKETDAPSLQTGASRKGKGKGKGKSLKGSGKGKKGAGRGNGNATNKARSA